MESETHLGATTDARWLAPPPPPREGDDDLPLAIGDVVALKSGGHAMTIDKFVPPPDLGGTPSTSLAQPKSLLHCIWHSADGLFQDRVLGIHAVTRLAVDPHEDPPAPKK